MVGSKNKKSLLLIITSNSCAACPLSITHLVRGGWNTYRNYNEGLSLELSTLQVKLKHINKSNMFVFHCIGKSKLKSEMISHQEKIVNQLKQTYDDSQLVKIAKGQKHMKALEESLGLVSKKLSEEKNRIVKDRKQQYHEKNMEDDAL